MNSLASHLFWLAIALMACIPKLLMLAECTRNAEDIDPNDMFNFDPVNMRMKAPSAPPDVDETTGDPPDEALADSCDKCTHHLDEACDKLKQSHDASMALLRQYVMRLVRVMEAKVSSTTVPTHLDLRAQTSYLELGRLRSFGEGSYSDLHTVYEILASLVKSAQIFVPESGVQARILWLEDWIGLSLPVLTHITVLFVAFLLTLAHIHKLRVTWSLLWRLLFVAFVISVIQNMVEMYQEKLAEQEQVLSKSIRENCPRAEDMTFWQRLYSFTASHFTFEDDSCKVYMKAILINPAMSVTPTQAIAVSFVEAFMTPMSLIGEGIKNLLVGLLKGLPVQYQAYVMTCIGVLIVLIPLLMSGYSFNFFHLIQISKNSGQPIMGPEVQHLRSNFSGPAIHYREYVNQDMLRLSDPAEDDNASAPRVQYQSLRGEPTVSNRVSTGVRSIHTQNQPDLEHSIIRQRLVGPSQSSKPQQKSSEGEVKKLVTKNAQESYRSYPGDNMSCSKQNNPSKMHHETGQTASLSDRTQNIISQPIDSSGRYIGCDDHVQGQTDARSSLCERLSRVQLAVDEGAGGDGCHNTGKVSSSDDCKGGGDRTGTTDVQTDSEHSADCKGGGDSTGTTDVRTDSEHSADCKGGGDSTGTTDVQTDSEHSADYQGGGDRTGTTDFRTDSEHSADSSVSSSTWCVKADARNDEGSGEAELAQDEDLNCSVPVTKKLQSLSLKEGTK